MSSLLPIFAITLSDNLSMYEVCKTALVEHPIHTLIEMVCVAIIIYLLTQRSYRTEAPLTDAEMDEILSEWKPEPLFPPKTDKSEPPVIEGPVQSHVRVGGQDVINLTSQDYLSLNKHPDIQEKAQSAIDKYGCGSCGPRGFYGTIDVHLFLEQKIQSFMRTEQAIIYAADIATLPSTIPTFSKAGDVLLCDEGSSYIVQEGCRASRSQVIKFKHNDMEDLEAKLIEITNKDKNNKKKKLTRRFIAFEALYTNFGDIADLPKLIELKHKYKFRLIMDESHSVGVLGATGRGLTEYYGVDVQEVDIITGTMTNSMASMGGFCCGSKQMVNHQRLSGAGYVFSASQPPYLCVAAIEALNVIDKDPTRIETLRLRTKQLREGLKKVVEKCPFVELLGHELSPVVVLSVADRENQSSDAIAAKIQSELLQHDILSGTIRSSPNEQRLVSGLRLVVNHNHTNNDINNTINNLSVVVQSLMDNN